MYNEEEIKDSLEFCQDIDVYYGNKKEASLDKYAIKRKAFQKRDAANKISLSENSFDSKVNSVLETDCDYDEDIKKIFESADIFRRLLDGFLWLFIVLFLAYGISSFLTNYCMWQTLVNGVSMEPALKDGDRLIIDKLTYHFQEPERFDIIVFPQDIDVYYVKRIIGLPGEKVEIIDGKIYIDGVILAENYGNEPMDENGSMEEVILGEDEYFVLGDNRNHSVDSRDSSVGFIKKKHIIGKAKVILYPFENIQFFK